MDGHIVGSMISANSIVGEQIQANSIKAANLELSVQKKIQDATDEETVKALIKADLDGFESTLSKEFITVENATTQIQQATEVAVKEATQNIIDNAVSESMGAVDGQLNDKLNQYTSGTLLPAIAEKAEEVLQNAEDYVVTQLESYATKQELSSSISQTREQIELSVSEKYTTKTESATFITEAIDGITVGAINRVFGTGENKSFKFNGGANETWLPYKFSNDVSDKEVFVSFKYTLTGTAQNGSQIEFAPSYLKKTNNQTVYRPKHIFFTSNRLQDVNITDTVSFTTKDFQDISPSSTSYIRFVENGFTGTLSISEVQIKPGNSKTTWSPAPEDTITDITNAKNDAIGSANNTLIATIANYYTKSETDSAISVAKDEINLGVSNTYETKTEVANKINAIQVGGTNLLPNTKTLESGVSSTSYITSDTYLGLKVMRCNNTSGSHIDAYYFNSLINVEPNTEYTLSFYAKGDGTFSSFFYPNNVVSGKHSNGTTTTSVDGHITTTVTNSWKRYWITWKTLSNTSGLKNVIIGRIAVGSDIYICGAKFEKGNKASEWSPAPEDIETTVFTIEQRVSTAESKITDTAITNTVKKSFYTKEETENAITSKGYATQTQLTQTSTQFEYKFSQTGGYNLIRNGDPKPWHEENWLVSPNGWWYRVVPDYLGIQTHDTNEAYASTNVFKVQHGATYSFSCWLMAESNTKGADVYFIGSEHDDGAHTEIHYIYNGSGDHTWHQVKKTFTVGSNINYGFIRIDNNGRKDTSNGAFNVVFFSEVQMVKGSECYPQWSPNPNEIYDGITTIDKDGVTVTASNVRSKTKMSADGFQLIRTTDNKKMFYVNQDGSLEMSGNLTQYDTNGKISIKIANNSYGCYDWLWDGDFVGYFGAFESNRKNTSGANQRFIGIANIADYGNQLILGVRSSPNSTNFNSYIEIDNTTLMHRDYVTFTANAGFKTNAIFRNPSNNNETGRIFGATNEHFFVTCNNHNQLRLGYEKNGSYYSAMSIYRNDNTNAGCAIEYYADEVHHQNVIIEGFLSVKGQKNRLVATENFGDRLLNAYETAECYFGDINETIIGEDGEVKVALDEVFLETVNTTEPYQVFLTKYGEGDCYVSERHEKYFVIKGTPNLSVGFEVKAKQRGYEKERLKMAVDTLKSHQATSCSPCSEDEVGYTIDCETTINRG